MCKAFGWILLSIFSTILCFLVTLEMFLNLTIQCLDLLYIFTIKFPACLIEFTIKERKSILELLKSWIMPERVGWGDGLWKDKDGKWRMG